MFQSKKTVINLLKAEIKCRVVNNDNSASSSMLYEDIYP